MANFEFVQKVFGQALHEGHIDMIESAKRLCGDGDNLCVIVNNEEQQKRKYGSLKHSVESIKRVLGKFVELVMISKDKDESVVQSLSYLHNKHGVKVFCNGGDRIATNTPEVDWCMKNGVMLAFNVGGGKKQHSSKIIGVKK